MPVWPSENRPGCGHTHRPWAPAPTLTRASSFPVVVSRAYASAVRRPASHSTLPSAETPPMSGVLGAGIGHVATTWRVAKSTTDTEPWLDAPPRLETYI